MNKAWHRPLLFTGFILLSQTFPLPSPVRDAATGTWPTGFSLNLPPLYLVFAPFCGIADRITLLSFHQLLALWSYAVVFSLVVCGWKRGLAALLGLILCLAAIALVPRPQARLVAQDPDVLLIDFHSHSEVSHDGRPGFSAAQNMRWHQGQGFNASFITDHNKIDSSKKAKELSRMNWRETGYRSLEGEEISLWKTHLVVLGVPERIDNQPYDTDAEKVARFIQDMKRKGHPVIASLPEYWWYHWPDSAGWGIRISTGGTTHNFARWGISGFEIVNSAPKALDFPPALRRQIVELCRSQDLFMTGISDTHGYGYATAVWNAMRLPGWRGLDPDQLEVAVIKTLKKGGVGAVEVLERLRYNPENLLGLLVSPWVNAAFYWRSFQHLEAVSWVIWIWLIFGINTWFKT